MAKGEIVKYCFIIPVYNHPYYLEALVQQLNTFHVPIIMINDGSDQACTALLQRIAVHYPLVDLIQHPVNQGKGQAVCSGLLHAHRLGLTHALQLDSDGQHDWSDITQFLQMSQQYPHAMIIGQPVFDRSIPKKRLYGRYLTHIWVWINSLSFDIKDSMCGFRVYPIQKTVDILNYHTFQPRMGFDTEILVRLKWENVTFINLPTKVIYPENGISHFNALKDNLEISKTHARLFAGMLVRLPHLLYRKLKR
ncbi:MULTISPECIES: glycosyltransferase family 2 protein [unclassified Acinetobacter]|uniref:glycosyltransferase family 2 protein n=1 Tax=unclassified Acinetobacter TaxID=196816 RepID=UPI00293520B1|nr:MULTISPECIES: glycosyltransferase family 2 protein [unclassified Acinetobacter]WOE31251.1 glycosyltransferase family 2 protein [Acinetobacter sp. SAAs470]WOE39447.1 glycosyltransferase family 2 protein [Acinetobacter sp. SAAs474]